MPSPLCYLIVLLFALPLRAADAPAWVVIAKHLTGESEAVTRNAIRRLRKLPGLETTLRAELSGENRALALDVIGTLGLKGCLADLMALSGSDEDGSVYLTIDSLIDRDNAQLIAELYSRSLEPAEIASVSFPSQVVIIDTLARLGVTLPEARLRRLLASPSFEVRLAALAYIRHFVKKEDLRYLSLVPVALASSPYQLRLRALLLIEELCPAARADMRRALAGCTSDPVVEVRRKCDQLKAPG